MIRLRSDVVVTDPHALVRWYEANVSRGPDYYRLHHLTGADADRIEFGDLAWAVLLEGQPRSRAAQSLLRAVVEDDLLIDIHDVPDGPLHELGRGDRDRIAAKLVALTGLDGFRAALASKTLHPKRRHAVPVLDNKAIFGTLANEAWHLGKPAPRTSAVSTAAIQHGLDCVFASVADPSADEGWCDLERQWAPRTRVELFDMCWWSVLHGGSALALAIET